MARRVDTRILRTEHDQGLRQFGFVPSKVIDPPAPPLRFAQERTDPVDHTGSVFRSDRQPAQARSPDEWGAVDMDGDSGAFVQSPKLGVVQVGVDAMQILTEDDPLLAGIDRHRHEVNQIGVGCGGDRHAEHSVARQVAAIRNGPDALVRDVQSAHSSAHHLANRPRETLP